MPKGKQLVYLGGRIAEEPDVSAKTYQPIRLAFLSFKGYGKEIYDRPQVRLGIDVRLLKTHVLKTAVRIRHVDPSPTPLRKNVHYPPPNVAAYSGSQNNKITYRVICFEHVFEETECETIGTTVRMP